MPKYFSAAEWEKHAEQSLNNILNRVPVKQRAKNIVLFIGDGMGLPTIAAARILKGQLKGKYEIPLAFENFPYTALSKTHSADRQVADSASTATAYLGGVKTNFGMSGMAAPYPFGKCSNDSEYEKNKVDSILTLAHKAGKSTGIVTTCRLTHASPSACYAHTADRDWESDSDMVGVKGGCSDIAKQLIDDNKYIQVLMGGGRYKFLPHNFTDPEKKERITSGRLDKRNLPEEWEKDKKDKNLKYKYIWNKGQFDTIDPATTDYVLGLFEPSHMQYDLDRDTSADGEPSLAEMVEKAIKILKRNKDGFFLFVEGGKIDSAHHDILAKKALYETLGLDKAVETALKLVDLKDTLVIATADHSISFATLGYGTRNNSILGLVDRIAWGGASDNMPYASLVYSSGPNHPGGRQNLTNVATDGDNYLPQVGVPLNYSSHTGEDVAIYSIGPWAHLFQGSMEQTNIHHFIAFAACLGNYDYAIKGGNCNSQSGNAATPLLPKQLIFWVALIALFNLFDTFERLG
ncbi:alkaline phosphatase [Octopus bimaculoides]|nr:alkaline phosphatase [Octopus bimaculoides]|eukprot:XP_014789116.1 PREDICTED: alkaline phosphatase-like isoform X2 [Octopus bimaculoides]